MKQYVPLFEQYISVYESIEGLRQKVHEKTKVGLEELEQLDADALLDIMNAQTIDEVEAILRNSGVNLPTDDDVKRAAGMPEASSEPQDEIIEIQQDPDRDVYVWQYIANIKNNDVDLYGYIARDPETERFKITVKDVMAGREFLDGDNEVVNKVIDAVVRKWNTLRGKAYN